MLETGTLRLFLKEAGKVTKWRTSTDLTIITNFCIMKVINEKGVDQ
ncbi:hypothetical protein HBHAL_2311 [Halobacillus halophilus DSM 2266]|uniref:Uncharacterized protein n=1 Tax=Halobacillus halophilus (strain ATCC 35676 / DSM 2266 / JCM 20832 / KCTC 3685 / LMG 17431 / NBRC 102448 / NCIMB 2269) TaxID=866895 RepID=I0JKI9_HALH3|nr:hypothetical protein HBHAL_2311 [Halobacillus halophilus DSM 2266]